MFLECFSPFLCDVYEPASSMVAGIILLQVD